MHPSRQTSRRLCLAALLLLGTACNTVPDLRTSTRLELEVPSERAAQVLAFVLKDHWPAADGEDSRYSAPLERGEHHSFRIHYAVDDGARVRVGQNCRVDQLDLHWRRPPGFTARARTAARGRTLIDLRIDPLDRDRSLVRFVDRSGDVTLERDLDEAFALMTLAADLRDRLSDRDPIAAAELADRFDRDGIEDAKEDGGSRLHDSLRSLVVAARISAEDRLGAHSELVDLVRRHPSDPGLGEFERLSTAIVASDSDWERSRRARTIESPSIVRRWQSTIDSERPSIDAAAIGATGDGRSERILLRRSIADDPDGAVVAGVERSLDDSRSALAIRYSEFAAVRDAADGDVDGRQHDASDSAVLLELCDDAIDAGDPSGAARLLARHWPDHRRSAHPDLRLRLERLRSTLGDKAIWRIARSERCSDWLPTFRVGDVDSAFARNLARHEPSEMPAVGSPASLSGEFRPNPALPPAGPR